MADAILVLNAGSSSIKFSLFCARATELELVAAGPGRGPLHRAALHGDGRGGQVARRDALGRRARRSATTARSTTSSASCASSRGGHRLIARRPSRGARRARVLASRRASTPSVLRALEKLVPLAPLHQPHNLGADPARARARCRSCRRWRASTPHSTATQPRAGAGVRAAARDHRRAACAATASTACPTSTSRARCRRSTPRRPAGRVVVAHLGNGASMCAMRGGQQRREHDGLHRARRPADGHALRRARSRRDALPDGRAEDGRARDREARSTSSRACSACPASRATCARCSPATSRARELAVDLFVYRIGRELGSLAAALGGLDALVFTGGIGEHAAPIRERVCRDAAWLGVELDADANAAAARASARASSRVAGLGDSDERGADDRPPHPAARRGLRAPAKVPRGVREVPDTGVGEVSAVMRVVLPARRRPGANTS